MIEKNEALKRYPIIKIWSFPTFNAENGRCYYDSSDFALIMCEGVVPDRYKDGLPEIHVLEWPEGLSEHCAVVGFPAEEKKLKGLCYGMEGDFKVCALHTVNLNVLISFCFD